MDRSTAAAEKWRRIAGEQTDSGQTVVEYCRQRGIAASSLFAWKRRLKCIAEGEAAASAFVEARISPTHRIDQRVPAAAAHIEVVCPGGRRVVVRPGFDRALLGAVIAALEALA